MLEEFGQGDVQRIKPTTNDSTFIVQKKARSTLPSRKSFQDRGGGDGGGDRCQDYDCLSLDLSEGDSHYGTQLAEKDFANRTRKSSRDVKRHRFGPEEERDRTFQVNTTI